MATAEKPLYIVRSIIRANPTAGQACARFPAFAKNEFLDERLLEAGRLVENAEQIFYSDRKGAEKLLRTALSSYRAAMKNGVANYQVYDDLGVVQQALGCLEPAYKSFQISFGYLAENPVVCAHLGELNLLLADENRRSNIAEKAEFHYREAGYFFSFGNRLEGGDSPYFIYKLDLAEDLLFRLKKKGCEATIN